MKKHLRLAFLCLLSVAVILGCTQPGSSTPYGGGGGGTAPVVTSSIVSAGSSSHITDNFTITWTCTSTGNVPIAILAGSLVIRGSAGGAISFSQTGTSLVYYAYWNPGQQYSFTITGNGGLYVPWYYDASLTITDGAGHNTSYSQSMVPFTIY